MRLRPVIACLLTCLALSDTTRTQAPKEFDAVSIKRNNAGPQAGAGIRSMPDGTYVMTNQPISSIIRLAAPSVVREVVGLPTWAQDDRYDVIAKPPAGATRADQSQMWRTMFADRMKLVARIEEREIDTYALVLDRADGRLGLQLKRFTGDCNAPVSTPPPASRTPAGPTAGPCGLSFGATQIRATGVTMNQFVQNLTGLAGRLVNNRTGLEDSYELQLDFSPPSLNGTTDTLPDVFTAVREQLGLRLQAEKALAPVFVIESIQRPSEN